MKVAAGEIGTREIPAHSNTGPRVREYQQATWLPGTNWPWCAAFVCWCYRQAGYQLPDRSARAWDLVDRAVRNGWGEQVPVARAKPGDIVAFRTGSGHVALFKAYNAKTNTVTTLDGNAGDEVGVNVRSATAIYRVVRVNAVNPPPAKPVRPPRFQVVTSVSGTRQVVASAPSLQALIGKLQKLQRRK